MKFTQVKLQLQFTLLWCIVRYFLFLISRRGNPAKGGISCCTKILLYHTILHHFVTNTKAKYGYWLRQQHCLFTFLLNVNFDPILDFGMCNSLIWARVNISIAIVTGKNNGRCDLCVCRSFDNQAPCNSPGRTSSKIKFCAFIICCHVLAIFWSNCGPKFMCLQIFWQPATLHFAWED